MLLLSLTIVIIDYAELADRLLITLVELGLSVYLAHELARAMVFESLHSFRYNFAFAQQFLQELSAELLLLLVVDLDRVEAVHRQHWPMVREQVVSTIIVNGKSCLLVVTLRAVLNQVSLEVFFTVHEHAITPGRNAILVTCIINIAIIIILVCGVKVERAFLEETQRIKHALRLQQLVIGLQRLVVFALDEIANLFIRLIDTEVHVSKYTLIVVINLFLSAHHSEVVERLRVALAEVLNSLLDCLLPTLKVHVDKAEAGVVDEEAKSYATLIARHAFEAGLFLKFAEAANGPAHILSHVHANVAADHELLENGNKFDALSICVQRLLDDIVPETGAVLIFTLDHLTSV